MVVFGDGCFVAERFVLVCVVGGVRLGDSCTPSSSKFDVLITSVWTLGAF